MSHEWSFGAPHPDGFVCDEVVGPAPSLIGQAMAYLWEAAFDDSIGIAERRGCLDLAMRCVSRESARLGAKQARKASEVNAQRLAEFAVRNEIPTGRTIKEPMGPSESYFKTEPDKRFGPVCFTSPPLPKSDPIVFTIKTERGVIGPDGTDFKVPPRSMVVPPFPRYDDEEAPRKKSSYVSFSDAQIPIPPQIEVIEDDYVAPRLEPNIPRDLLDDYPDDV